MSGRGVHRALSGDASGGDGLPMVSARAHRPIRKEYAIFQEGLRLVDAVGCDPAVDHEDLADVTVREHGASDPVRLGCRHRFAR
jgi:hypothetical protein